MYTWVEEGANCERRVFNYRRRRGQRRGTATGNKKDRVWGRAKRVGRIGLFLWGTDQKPNQPDLCFFITADDVSFSLHLLFCFNFIFFIFFLFFFLLQFWGWWISILWQRVEVLFFFTIFFSSRFPCPQANDGTSGSLLGDPNSIQMKVWLVCPST